MSGNIGSKQNLRLRNTLLASAGGGVLSLILIYAYHTGNTSLSLSALILALGIFWFVCGVFITIILTNYNLKFNDPSLSLAQMYWATSTSLVVLSMVTEYRELVYVLLLITMVFGIFRVTLKEYNVFSLLMFLGCIVVEAFYKYQHPIEYSFLDFGVHVLVIGFCIFGLNMLCKSAVILRAKLKDKNNQLEKAVEVKSMFLANMSHEIRTPMNGVIGVLEMVLKNSSLDIKTIESLSLAKSSAKSLLGIINDILDFSKIEAGKLSIEHTQFNLLNLVEEIIEISSFSAYEKGLEIIFITDPQLPKKITSDPTRLRQVLNNIIGNAIKFTEEGEVCIKLNYHQDSKLLTIDVADTGIGIVESNLAQLFTSFSQADNSTTRKFGGTGLGLAISKELTTLMGGDITVKSEINVGSTFSITLPVNYESNISISPFEKLNNYFFHTCISNTTLQTAIVNTLTDQGCTTSTYKSLFELLKTIEKIIDMNHILIIDHPTSEEVMHQINHDLRLAKKSNDLHIFFLGHEMIPKQVDLQKLDYPENIKINSLKKPFLSSHLKYIESLVTSQHADIEEPISSTKIQKKQKNKILLVDDNETNCTVAELMFNDIGYEVEKARNGVQAVELFRKKNHQFLLIFMDCQMPEMDGYQSTHEIRTYEILHNLPPIPIIAMTANALEGDREKCLRAGMNDYLSKPIEVEKILKALEKWTDKIETEIPVSHKSTSNKIKYPDWDFDNFLKRVRGKQDRAKHLIEIFLEDLPNRQQAIDSAMNNVNFPELEKAVHSLKGTASNLGAIKLQEQMIAIEKLIATGQYAMLKDNIHQAHTICNDFKQTLSDYLNQS